MSGRMGGRVVGRYLMRHYNEIVFGVFPNGVVELARAAVKFVLYT